MSSPIVLLSDFGLRDPYVGVMKGVLQSINSKAPLMDITHDVCPQNILQGAIMLESSYPYFPKGSVFLCVVDPGVGTERKLIAVKAGKYYFVAPDNGLLSLALKNFDRYEVRSLDNKKFHLKSKLSTTFHGRDIFAPVAGHLSKGVKFSDLGKKMKQEVRLKYPKPKVKGKTLLGEILFFDHYGNAISNIRARDTSKIKGNHYKVKIKKQLVAMPTDAYGKVKKGMCALMNSFDHLEVAVPNGSAQKNAKLKVGDPLEVVFRS